MKPKQGFTLVELMIVVAIIGVMAAIAIPNFLNYMCKAKQSEAKMGLGNIANAQEAYLGESQENIYTTSFNLLGFAPKGGSTRYTYYFTIPATTGGFEAAASTSIIKGDKTDAWSINQERTLRNTINACIGL